MNFHTMTATPKNAIVPSGRIMKPPSLNVWTRSSSCPCPRACWTARSVDTVIPTNVCLLRLGA